VVVIAELHSLRNVGLILLIKFALEN